MSNINLENVRLIGSDGIDLTQPDVFFFVLKGMLVYFVIAVVLYIGYRILKKQTDKKCSERGENSEV